MNCKNDPDLNKTKYNRTFFDDVAPTKMTEGRRVKLHTVGWGILSEYYLESVKITWLKSDKVLSTATVKIRDRSGQTICYIKGPTVGTLFGKTAQEWVQIENLCGQRQQQLFYRFFKDGANRHCGLEQKLFYNFCLTNQKSNVLVAIFKRGVNMRNRDRSDAFLDILELRKGDSGILELYISHLRQSASNELMDQNNELNKKINESDQR